MKDFKVNDKVIAVNPPINMSIENNSHYLIVEIENFKFYNFGLNGIHYKLKCLKTNRILGWFKGTYLEVKKS
jgi:hypothetical protein